MEGADDKPWPWNRVLVLRNQVRAMTADERKLLERWAFLLHLPDEAIPYAHGEFSEEWWRGWPDSAPPR